MPDRATDSDDCCWIKVRNPARAAMRRPNDDQEIFGQEGIVNENINIWVRQPDVVVNQPRTGVYIQFEQMDPKTLKGTGKPHTVGMTMADAMRLLSLLSEAQRYLSLPKEKGTPIMTRRQPKKQN